MTPGASPLTVNNIPGIYIMNPVISGNLTCVNQGCRGSWGNGSHFPIGVESGKVDGDAGAQVFDNPLGELLEFTGGIVDAGDQEGREFQPHLGFFGNIFDDVENGLQVTAAKVVVEVVGECFQVDIGGVHVGKEKFGGFGVDIAGGDGHGLDALFVASSGAIDGVFQEDDGIVVGIGNATTAGVFGHVGDICGGGLVGESVHVGGFGDIPILAKFTGQVTPGGAKGKDGGSGEEMVEWFFFNGVNAKAAGTTVGVEDHLVVVSRADEADSLLIF